MFIDRMGGLPLFRHLSKATRDVLNELFEPVFLAADEPFPTDILEDIVIVDDARVVATSTYERDGQRWTAVTAARRGAVLSAKPLRPHLFGSDAGKPSYDVLPPTKYDVATGGRVWRARSLDGLVSLSRVRSRLALKAHVVEPLSFSPTKPNEIIRAIAALEWIDRAPESELMTPIQRLALARTVRVDVIDAGTALARHDETPEAVRLLGPGAIVRHSVPRQHEVFLFCGGMTAFAAFPRESSASTSVVTDRGWVLSWSPDFLGWLTGASPLDQGGWMARFCRERETIDADADAITHALRETPILDNVPEPRVRALLCGASLCTWRVGAPPPVPVGLEPGLCVIVAGEVVGARVVPAEIGGAVARVRFDPVVVGRGELPGDDGPRVMQVIGIGETVGALRAMLAGTKEDDEVFDVPHFAARVPSRGVFVPAWRVGRALGPEISANVSHHAGKLMQHHRDRAALAALDDTSDTTDDDLTIVWTTDPSGGAIGENAVEDGKLLEQLATYIASPDGFSERCLLVEIVAGDDGAVEPVDQGHGWRRVRLLTSKPYAVEHLLALLAKNVDVSYAFVWATPSCPIGDEVAMAADVVMVMNHQPTAPRPQFGDEHAAFLYVNLVRVETNAQLPPTTVRAHALTDPRAPNRGFAGREEAIARWARAVSRRRVGIALGGGGAWGWAHVALIYEMERRRIPVDMVAGASFGAVAGAFYAVGGLPGLWYAINEGSELQRAIFSSMILGQPIAKYIDELPGMLEKNIDRLQHFDPLPTGDDAGERVATGPNVSVGFDPENYRENLAMMAPRPVNLQHTPIPFFPVATDIVAGSESPVLRTSVGRGVRASGSLPPLFPVTREDDAAYADGGLSRNVPADVVQLEGAALIVGSNIVPPPFVRAPEPFQSRAGRVLARLNPARRALSAVLGFQTLFNQAGAIDTGLAPVLFQSEWDGKLFFQIDKARDIVTDTMATQRFWQALDGLDGRWRNLKKPRKR